MDTLVNLNGSQMTLVFVLYPNIHKSFKLYSLFTVTAFIDASSLLAPLDDLTGVCNLKSEIFSIVFFH